MTGNELKLSSNKRGNLLRLKVTLIRNVVDSCFHDVQREYEGPSGVRQRFL